MEITLWTVGLTVAFGVACLAVGIFAGMCLAAHDGRLAHDGALFILRGMWREGIFGWAARKATMLTVAWLLSPVGCVSLAAWMWAAEIYAVAAAVVAVRGTWLCAVVVYVLYTGGGTWCDTRDCVAWPSGASQQSNGHY
jgi:hypothetical protein